MLNALDNKEIKFEQDLYLQKVFLKNLAAILILGILILFYYTYSDWTVRHNLNAVFTRIPSILLAFFLLIYHLVFPQKHYKFKKVLYIILYLALQLMMYGICLVHMHEAALAPSVTGTILIIFLLSLDVKENNTLTIFIYGIPILLFSALLYYVGKPSSTEFYVLVDVYPILLIGFFINRIQYKLRLRLFKSNMLLEQEKEKANSLYADTLAMNKELKKKTNEALFHKEALQEKNTKLNKINATKDKFLSIIAHDLKNPIGTAWGFSDLLIQDEDLDCEQKQECLLAINNSLKHTHELLDNLLNWARAQSNNLQINTIDLNAKALVDNELKVLHEIAFRKSITIQNAIPDDFIVYADLNMIETIIRNLISNAIKFSYPNGVIEIYADVVEINNKTFTQIKIKDFGVGMSHEKMDRLFEVTNHISTKGTNNEKGTGLGLLLCKEFVELHKGNIFVESHDNKGSTFIIQLPVNSISAGTHSPIPQENLSQSPARTN